MSEKVAVLGLGYVGLPLMIGLARHFDGVVGFDIDARRVAALKDHHDWTGEVSRDELAATTALMTAKPEDMDSCNFFIVTVPTPIDEAKRPDLGPVLSACRTMGALLKRRAESRGEAGAASGAATGKSGLVPLIVFESTVYPGLTEDLCGSKIEELSGLKRGKDFKLGYSPERINPGDKVNRLETIMKVISAEDKESLDRLDAVYGAVITAGLHRAENIRVAETAKVLENTQRDLNIALMNELAMICDKIGIRTSDVLRAAGTKWNFLKFAPGLVGGHCIGVDPYYLTARAEELGYHPQVILAGRRINDGMPVFVAHKVLKLLSESGHLRKGARVGVLGLSFKENVRDLRNSRVPEIVAELRDFGLEVLVHDPVADPAHAQHEYGLALTPKAEMKELDALILAVPHKAFLDDLGSLWSMLVPNGHLADVKSVIAPDKVPHGFRYWSL